MTGLVRGWWILFPQGEFIMRSQLSSCQLPSRQWPVKSLGPQRLRWFKRSEGRGLGCGGRGRGGEICGLGEAAAREPGGRAGAGESRIARECWKAVEQWAGPESRGLFFFF